MSQEIEFSKHARDMLIERKITEEWVWRAIDSFDRKETGADGNSHYLKAIEERKGYILRVVVNPHVSPNRIVTLFFDHHLRRK